MLAQTPTIPLPDAPLPSPEAGVWHELQAIRDAIRTQHIRLVELTRDLPMSRHLMVAETCLEGAVNELCDAMNAADDGAFGDDR